MRRYASSALSLTLALLACVASPTAAHAAVTLAPVADSYVDASVPGSNYGTLVKVRADGSPVVRSYLRFDVQGWTPGGRATLRLFPTSSLASGPSLQVARVADTTWGERTLTAANAPAIGATIATTPLPSSGTWLSIDVTSALSGNGLASFAVTSANSTAEALASREAGAATAPQLVLDTPTTDSAPPAPTLTTPADGALLGTSAPTFSGVAGTAPGDLATVNVLIWQGTDTSVAPLQTLPAAALVGGAYSVAASSALPDGGYTALVEQRDGAGNLGRSGARSFTIDTSAPQPALQAPADGSTTSDNTPLLSGTGGTAPGDSGTVSAQIWQGTNLTGAPVVTTSATRDPTTGAFSVETPSALPDGVYTVRAQQADGAGNTGVSAPRTFTVSTTTGPPPTQSTLAPAADSYVDTSSPATNYGTQPKLRTDGSPVVRSFLRFDVQGWVPGTSRATLRLSPTSSLLNGAGVDVSRVGDVTWGERTITAANAPALGSALGTIASPRAGVPTATDVTAAIAGNGPVSFGLSSANPTAEALASREGATSAVPQLVIDNSDIAPPAPVLSSPADGALLGTGTPTFDGTAGTAAGDAATLTVLIWAGSDTDGAPVQSLPAAALVGGAFSVTAGSPLADGPYTAVAEQSDAAGNTGRSPARSFTVDTAAPAPVLSAPAADSSTGDDTPSFNGTAGNAAGDAQSVSIRVWQGSDTTADPLVTFDAARDSAGAFSAESPATLPDGPYTAEVQQTDVAGHTGQSAEVHFTVDTAAPTPSLTQPPSGSTGTDPSPDFAGTAGTAPQDSSAVTIAVWDGTATSGQPTATFDATADPTTGAFSAKPPAPLDGGTYTARAEQVDAAGNRGTSATTTFAIDGPDLTAPRVSLATPADGASTNDATPGFSGHAGTRPGDLDAVEVKVWAGTDTSGAPALDLSTSRDAGGDFATDAPSDLGDGRYTVRALQDDAGGNHGASTDSTFTVDTAAPQPTLTQPADGSTTDTQTPTLSGAAGTAPGDASSVAVLVWQGSTATGDPALTLNATPAGDGTFSVTAPDPLPAGPTVARVEQLDSAGNRGTSGLTAFTVGGLPDPTIAAAGDISCGAASTGAACRAMATSDLLLQLNPDAVLALGDTQYENGEYSNYQNFFDPSWGRLKSKLYPAVGNHEYGASVNSTAGSTCDVQVPGDPRSYACGYFDYFDGKGNMTGRAGDRGGGYYAFDVGHWRIYAMNSNCSRPGAPGCAAGSAQEQWLRADLQAHPRECQLMFMHHPLFTSDTREFDTPAFRDALRPLWAAFDQYGGDVVLTGHSHFYERYLPQTPFGVADETNGIQQFIVGTGGRNVYNVDPAGVEPTSVVHSGSSFGVLQLTLHPASYDWNFRAIPGALFNDSGSRSCH